MATPAPASLAAQVEAEKGLPVEIVKAIRHLTTVCMVAPGFNDAVIANRNIRNGVEALTAMILARLTAAESAREALKAEIRDQAMKQLASDAGWELENDKLRAERDAALARAERAEKALEPFAEAADNLEDHEDDSRHLWESPEAMMLMVGDLRAARAALADGKAPKTEGDA